MNPVCAQTSTTVKESGLLGATNGSSSLSMISKNTVPAGFRTDEVHTGIMIQIAKPNGGNIVIVPNQRSMRHEIQNWCPFSKRMAFVEMCIAFYQENLGDLVDAMLLQ